MQEDFQFTDTRILTDLMACVRFMPPELRFSADAACSVLATEDLDSETSLRLGVELLFLLVKLTWNDQQKTISIAYKTWFYFLIQNTELSPNMYRYTAHFHDVCFFRLAVHDEE